jgi:GT2 family glycosyltransferase
LIRRSAWETVTGVDEQLHMAMDYDLWWRLFKQIGALQFVDEFVAVNREHNATKTKTLRCRHYQEAMAVVRKHHGRLPMKWWLAQPYAVWFKSIVR